MQRQIAAQNKAAEEAKSAPPKKKGFLDRLFGKSKPKADALPKRPPQTQPTQSEMSEFDAQLAAAIAASLNDTGAEGS